MILYFALLGYVGSDFSSILSHTFIFMVQNTRVYFTYICIYTHICTHMYNDDSDSEAVCVCVCTSCTRGCAKTKPAQQFMFRV